MLAVASLLLGMTAVQATTAAAPTPATMIPSDPRGIISALAAVQSQLAIAGDCTDRDPRSRQRPEFEALDDLFQASLTQAEGTWADFDRAKAYAAGASASVAKQRCGRKEIGDALKEGKAALDRYTLLYRRLTAPMLGKSAWAGPMRLCKTTVAGADVVTDALTKKPALAIRLTASARTPWEEVGTQSAGRPLAVRLDGAVVGDLKVFPANSRSGFQIVGPERAVLSAIGERAKAGC
jgi:hypothetical protein